MKNSVDVANYLREHNLYELLDITFKNYQNCPLSNMLANLYVTGSLSRLIQGFFKWSNTPQGYDFWDMVNREYRNWLEC